MAHYAQGRGISQLVHEIVPWTFQFVRGFLVLSWFLLWLVQICYLRGDTISASLMTAWNVAMDVHCIRRVDYKGKKLDHVARSVKLPFDALTCLAVFFAVPWPFLSGFSSVSFT